MILPRRRHVVLGEVKEAVVAETAEPGLGANLTNFTCTCIVPHICIDFVCKKHLR